MATMLFWHILIFTFLKMSGHVLKLTFMVDQKWDLIHCTYLLKKSVCINRKCFKFLGNFVVYVFFNAQAGTFELLDRKFNDHLQCCLPSQIWRFHDCNQMFSILWLTAILITIMTCSFFIFFFVPTTFTTYHVLFLLVIYRALSINSECWQQCSLVLCNSS